MEGSPVKHLKSICLPGNLFLDLPWLPVPVWWIVSTHLALVDSSPLMCYAILLWSTWELDAEVQMLPSGGQQSTSPRKIFSTSLPGKWENLYSDLSGKIEGKRRRGRQRMKWLDDITDSMDMNLGGLWEMVKDREAWRAVVHEIAKVGHDTATEQGSENKLTRLGTLLMVQGLRSCTPSAGAQLSIPIQGTRSACHN